MDNVRKGKDRKPSRPSEVVSSVLGEGMRSLGPDELPLESHAA